MTDRRGVPDDDVVELGGLRDPADQAAFAASDEVDRLGEMSDTRIYEGELEARTTDSDQPDDPDAANLELLVERELRAGETDDPREATEEGMPWVPPIDPPVVPGERAQPEIAAGFGTTADDEPFDADHHATALPEDDEWSARVREALLSHAETSGLVDRLRIETLGSTVVVEGTVDDISDEDAVMSVVADIDGVSDVVSHLDVAAIR